MRQLLIFQIEKKKGGMKRAKKTMNKENHESDSNGDQLSFKLISKILN